MLLCVCVSFVLDGCNMIKNNIRGQVKGNSLFILILYLMPHYFVSVMPLISVHSDQPKPNCVVTADWLIALCPLLPQHDKACTINLITK